MLEQNSFAWRENFFAEGDFTLNELAKLAKQKGLSPVLFVTATTSLKLIRPTRKP
jgi:hypothetical protein